MGTPARTVEKSRRRTVGNSNTTRLRVAHWGSGTLVGSGPIARWTNPRAAADANTAPCARRDVFRIRLRSR